MFKTIFISRLVRLAHNDKTLPRQCFSRWWYADSDELCKCKDLCKYVQFSKKEWEDLANESYPKIIYSPKEK